MKLHDLEETDVTPENEKAWKALVKLAHALDTRFVVPDFAVMLIPGIVYKENSNLDRPPLWMLIVGPSSAGKTTAVDWLKGQDNVFPVSDLTRAGLLSGAEAKEGATGGVLQQVREAGGWGLLGFKDLTTALAGNRDQVSSLLGALREVYDGDWNRYLGTEGGRVLDFSGKIGVIGGITYAGTTRMHDVSDMGERCLYVTIPELKDTQADLAISVRAAMNMYGAGASGAGAGSKSSITDCYLEWVGSYDPHAAHITHRDAEYLARYATIVSACRANVPRDRQHQIVAQPKYEASARVTQQLTMILHAARCLGFPVPCAWKLVRNVALSSMPFRVYNTVRSLLHLLGPDRKGVTIQEVFDYPVDNPEIGISAWVDMTILGRVMQDLEVMGVIRVVGGGKGGKPVLYGWDKVRHAGSALSELMK